MTLSWDIFFRHEQQVVYSRRSIRLSRIFRQLLASLVASNNDPPWLGMKKTWTRAEVPEEPVEKDLGCFFRSKNFMRVLGRVRKGKEKNLPPPLHGNGHSKPAKRHLPPQRRSLRPGEASAACSKGFRWKTFPKGSFKFSKKTFSFLLVKYLKHL